MNNHSYSAVFAGTMLALYWVVYLIAMAGNCDVL